MAEGGGPACGGEQHPPPPPDAPQHTDAYELVTF